MKKNNNIKRFAAALGAAAIMLNCVCLPLAVAEPSVVTISSADDLIEFLKGCTSDEYSKGRTFVISNDIDMSGKKFSGGGIFCGILMGNGHTIRNISMDFREANGGLFTNIGVEGQVRDLNLSGDFSQYTNSSEGISAENIVGDIMKNAGISGISPSASTGITGAVAAVNSGLIVDCTFEGTITGQKSTGGIVGKNNDTGIIDTCANAAAVSGVETTGGIAGENKGVIKNSRNAGKINPEAEETTRETGGIAGLSTGVIEYSNNEGEIGCEGYGSNTGGIAGKQNGALIECKNTGSVGAKNNAGGIVGIFVPFTDTEIITEDLKDEWQRQKDDLKNEADKLRDKLKQNADELTNGLGKFNLGLGSSGSVDRVLNSLADYIDSAAQRRSEASSSAKDSLESLSGALEDALNDRRLENQAAESLSKLSDSIADVSGSMSKAVDRTSELTDDIDELTANLTKLTDDTSVLLSTVNGTVSGMSGRLDSNAESFEKVSDSLAAALDRTDLDTDALDKAAQALLNMTNTLDDVIDDLEDLGYDVRTDLTKPLRELRQTINKITNEITDRKENLDNIKKQLEELKKKIDDKIQGLIPTIKPIPTAAPKAKTAEEDQPSMKVGKAILDKLFITAEAANDDDNNLLSLNEILDTDRIKEEMKKVISVDVALDRNVAGEYTDTALVKSCINTGEVRASENAGGIAGNMGVESLRKNGETLQLSDGKTVVSDLAVKATIHSCINDGEIYASQKNAGGIAGSSNVGIIKECLGAGEVEAANTGYAGGIGGSVNASILYSVGAARVRGENDLGGIAGKGNVIRECYSLATFEGDAERIGMIAGSADGDVKNNCFISEEIGGVGGASYETNAENIPFEDMKCTDTLPEKMDMFFNDDWVSEQDCFPQIKSLAQTDAQVIGLDIRALSAKYAETVFRVSFIVDGNVVKSLKKNYDEKLLEEEIPVLTGADGRYPHWNRDTSEPIRRHTDFKAEYTDATMTIASDETPPIILLEGNFSDSTTVETDDTEITASFFGYSKGNAYSFKINPKKDGEAGFKIHVLARDDKACALGVVREGQPEVIECERDGSYLVGYMDGPQSFVILSKQAKALPITMIVIGGGGILFMILAAIAAKKRNIGIIKYLKTRYGEKDKGEEDRNDGRAKK